MFCIYQINNLLVDMLLHSTHQGWLDPFFKWDRQHHNWEFNTVWEFMAQEYYS